MPSRKKPEKPPLEPPEKGAAEDGGKEKDLSPEAKYYRLKTRAVDDLVNANAQNSPEVSPEELRKYHSGPHLNLSDWLKAVLIKAWFAGVIGYFFIWGLSTFTLNPWDHIVILGVALGTVTNLITNNVLRFIARKRGSYDRWMMVTSGKLLYLPVDIGYALVLVICVLMTYNAINAAFAVLRGTENAVLGVEPVLFGVFTTAWDLLFLGIKQTLKKIFSDAKRKAREG